MHYKRSVVILSSLLICAFMAASLFGAADDPANRSYFKLNRAPKFAIPFERGPVGGISKDDAAMMSLGYVPTTSPGFQAGLTTYEYQHNGSMGRQIAFNPVNNIVHFVWMAQTDYTIPGDRHIRYQAYDAMAGTPDYTQDASGKKVTADYSGYASLDVTDIGSAYFSCHTDPSGEHYYSYGYVDYAAGFGIFTELYQLRPDPSADWYFEDDQGVPLEVIWPQIEVHYGTEAVVYALSHVFGGSEDMILYRKVGTNDWNGGDYVETVTDLSYLIVANQNSDSVYIVYTDDRVGEEEGSGGQVDLDVWYMLSEDQGATWGAAVSVTNYTEDSLWRAYSDAAALVTEPDGFLHILWSARELRDANTYENYKCRLMHWDNNFSTANIVSEARYDMGSLCDPDAWNMYIAKMSISQCDGNLYAVWTQFGDPQETDGMIDCSQSGFANGELYFCGSDDGGLTWDLPENLTNSRTPDCDSSECDSDHWSSMVRYGMVYGGAADTLDILYMNDKDAGGIPQGSGSWCVNPVMHLRVPCRAIAHMPKTSYEPTAYIDPIHTDPGVELVQNLKIINIGNDPLNWTANIIYVDGSGWLTMSDNSGAIAPAPAINYTDITVTLNAGGILTDDPSGWDAYIEITSAAPTSPDTIPVHLTVASEFYMPVEDTLSTSAAGPRAVDGKAIMIYNTARMGGNSDGYTLDIPEIDGECDTEDQFPNTDIWLYDASPVISWVDGTDTLAYTTVFTQLFTEPGTFRPQGDIVKTVETGYQRAQFEVSTSDSIFGVDITLITPTDGTNKFLIGRQRFKLWDGVSAKSSVNVGMIMDWDIPSDSSVDNGSGFINESITIPVGSGSVSANLYSLYQFGAEYHDDNTSVPCNIVETDRLGGIVVFNQVAKGGWTEENAPYQIGSGYRQDYLLQRMATITDTTLLYEGVADDTLIDLHSGVTYQTLDMEPGKIYTYTFALLTTIDGYDNYLEQLKAAYAWAMENDICVRPGDANNDGAVNVGDAVYLINYVFKGGSAPANEDHGDTNADCAINVGDAVYLINYVFKGGTAPNCGCKAN